MRFPELMTTIHFPKAPVETLRRFIDHYAVQLLFVGLTVISVTGFVVYYHNGLGLAYNDARSHLDIGRRVVEGLKPGIAQLGSVWLPLPHILMIPTIWNDFMWHSGLSGSIVSMISFVATGVLIFKILELLRVSYLGRAIAIFLFVANINILYLQSTAMTELLLIATMTAAVYELIRYHQDDSILTMMRLAFWVMMTTLIRYDGWFLFFVCALLVVINILRKKEKFWPKLQHAEGFFILFCTLAGFGIFLWILWNAVIFKDPLYFAFGPYSAHAQQEQLADAGVLITQHNWSKSIETYWFAMLYNSGTFSVLVSFVGVAFVFIDRKLSTSMKLAVSALLAPLFFNVLALYLGHSVLFVQGLNGDTWFNVRYGIMMMPSIVIFIGFLVDRIKSMRWVLIGLLCFVTFFATVNQDAVTIDDGRVGSSQKNVSEVSSWLAYQAKNLPGFILISAASHDAIIFSSGLPMSKFIHEGTGTYWTSATTSPDRWARWIVMRTNDPNDQTFKLVNKSGALWKYDLVASYPFADVYQLNDTYLDMLQTKPVLPKQK